MAYNNGSDATVNAILRERIEDAVTTFCPRPGQIHEVWFHIAYVECLNAQERGHQLGARYRTVQLPVCHAIRRALAIAGPYQAPRGADLDRYARWYEDSFPLDGRYTEMREENDAHNTRQNQRRAERRQQRVVLTEPLALAEGGIKRVVVEYEDGEQVTHEAKPEG